MASSGGGGPGDGDADRQVEIWKVKKLIKSLQACQGSGTSMISLLMPPGAQIARTNAMLTEEYGTAQNIKSRVNRLSVLDAITSAQQRLKLFSKVPPNGLVLYCGTVQTEEGKEKRMAIAFEPLKPINKSFYLCDSKFHTEALEEMLEDDDKFGFIVMDGSGCLYGTVQGNNRDVLHKFTVDLPKKHGRGGQSAVRFARLRMEKRHNYVRKVAELAVQYFITDNRPNVGGLVLAGSADFKTELQTSGLFDPRLQKVVLQTVDVSYGGDQGFNQAIELAAGTLGEVKLVQEKKLLQRFFDEISQDTGKFCFGIDETLKALELGAVETLIIWEALETTRCTVRDKSTQEEKVIHVTKQQEETGDSHLRDPVTGVELEVIEKIPFVEWLADNYKKYGAVLEMVTDRSQEGAQFCRGFGGVGGLLRWKVDFDDHAGYGDLDADGPGEREWDEDESPF